jgi:signal transduction histidine kinase
MLSVMSQQSSVSQNIWPRIAAVAGVAALSAILMHADTFDRNAFDLITQLFGGEVRNHGSPLLLSVLEPATLLIFASAAAAVVHYTSRAGRILLLAQILMLSVLSQWALWQWAGMISHPSRFIVAIVLGALFGGWLRFLTERKTFDTSRRMEIRLREKEILELKLQIVKQAEIDRRLLAADLHDQVLNDLKIIKGQLEIFFKEQDAGLGTSIRTNLAKAQSEIREVMDNLCPVTLELMGLASGIEYCVRRGAERGGFKGKVRNKLKGDELNSLSFVEQTLVYRLIQESITNICKHANASSVYVNITREDSSLLFKIIDDGVGVNIDKLDGTSRGVIYMRQRADLLGADIAWLAGENGKGTVVEIRMAIPEKNNGDHTNS